MVVVVVVAGGGGGGVVAGGGGIGAIIDQQGQHFFGDPLGVEVGVAPNVVFVGQWLEGKNKRCRCPKRKC